MYTRGTLGVACDLSDTRMSLVGTASNTAGAILRAGKTLLITRLLVSARTLGGTSGAVANDVALINSVFLVTLCADC